MGHIIQTTVSHWVALKDNGYLVNQPGQGPIPPGSVQ